MADYILKNMVIVDGTGNEPYLGQVELSSGKIQRVTSYLDEKPTDQIDDQGKTVVDGQSRLVLSPGFIDIHTHENYYVFHDPKCSPKLLQGVTTLVAGNCGYSCAPVSHKYFKEIQESEAFFVQGINMPEEWRNWIDFRFLLEALEDNRQVMDVKMLVGHGNLRASVMGFEDRKASCEELRQMGRLLEEALEAGAMGMSSGLYYPPGIFADQDEMIYLCKIVAKHGGIYATHIRAEGSNVLPSVEEAINVARESGVKLQISHLKVAVFDYKEKLEKVKALIDEANKEGMDIHVDQYPYNTAATTLAVLMPPDFIHGGNSDIANRLKDPKTRARLHKEILVDDCSWDNCIRDSGFENIKIVYAQGCDYAAGKSLEQLGKEKGIHPLDAMFDLFIKCKGEGMCTMEYTYEECIEEILKLPYTIVASDGILLPDTNNDHPRGYATFNRVLGRYVRERKTIGLAEAVHKMTGLPAKVYAIDQGGLIKEGFKGDLVVFDPDTIIDKADFVNSKNPNIGIEKVFKNGVLVVDQGKVL